MRKWKGIESYHDTRLINGHKNVEPGTLKEFEDMVCKDFTGPGPYPTYILQTILKLAATSTNLFPAVAPNNSTSPIPSFGPRHTSPPKPTPLPPQIHHHQNPQSAYISPPSMPNTPSPSQSDSTSPASSALPPTPMGMVDDNIAIVDHHNFPGLSIQKPQDHMEAVMLKQQMFAFAAPSVW